MFDVTQKKGRYAPPRAGAMVEALRGMGYSPATALADIIDNSIAAGAGTVNIRLSWGGVNSSITICDDGQGMDDTALETAMSLGARDPREQRAAHDLGRFGLGLKTASFSQARRLTVASRRGGVTSVLRWDLDVLADDPEGHWILLEGTAEGSEALTAFAPECSSGTIVLWENMDRIVPTGTTADTFLNIADDIERHLGMVFHRFIEKKTLTIYINGRAILPWNPFLPGRTDTWRSGADQFNVNGNTIRLEGFVLPHRDRMKPTEWAAAEGPDGWTAQQGFYVYRNERMLVAGSWLGLGSARRSWTKDECYRLARICLDLPNTGDDDWKIDIRKSRARPPAEARQRLILFAEDVRQRARRVFAFRSKPQPSAQREPVIQAWRADHLKDGVRYRIERTHPVIALALSEAGAMTQSVEAVLRIVEETVPVQQIWLDTAESKDTPGTGFDGPLPDEIRQMMQTIFNRMISHKGYSAEAAKRHLHNTEPFNQYPTIVDALEITERGAKDV